MTDNLTKEQRKKNMRAIKSQSTLENKVTKDLWRLGFRFRKNANLYGKPDISIKKYKIVIFIDSCFWHCCPVHGNMPKSNKDYWEKKLERNIQRDIEVNQYYIDKGWNILRVWEHDLKENPIETTNLIENFIRENKKKYL
jgi:DNA mismatch endonuclease, patch repair protein